MGKFCFKVFIIAFLIAAFSFVNCYFDTFNVFHWDNIRITTASLNNNFVKTKYVVHNKDKFNAFVFGSSRVANIPQIVLPNELDEKPLNWYNMTCPWGIPAEHFLTLKTFLKNGVRIKTLVLAFDELAMYRSLEIHRRELGLLPYQMYEENKLNFYRRYIQAVPPLSIVKEVLRYNPNENEEAVKLFYNYGGNNWNLALGEKPPSGSYESTLDVGYAQKDACKDIENFSKLCAEHDIKLIVFTNPIYETTYKKAVGAGYFDLLKKVAEHCEFYNFSSLNNYTTDSRYYYESSHYRPALGLLVGKFLFGTESEREKIRRESGDDLWGVKVNSQNIEQIIDHLKSQLNR